MKTISLIIFAFLSQITLSQEEIKSNSNETSKNTEIKKKKHTTNFINKQFAQTNIHYFISYRSLIKIFLQKMLT